MDTKISYAGILRRVLACVVDGVLWMIIAFVSLLFDLDNVDKNMTILMATLLITYIIFNILTITKYGCTPGRLLCSVRIKDANTFKNVTLMQSTIRYIFREGIWV
ncbi:RDD family protein, partial [Wolbachia endosymbiont of Culex molestus]